MLHAWIFSITSNTYFNNQWFKKKIYTSHFPASDSTFQPAGQLTRKLVNMPTDQTSGQWPSISLPPSQAATSTNEPFNPFV